MIFNILATSKLKETKPYRYAKSFVSRTHSQTIGQKDTFIWEVFEQSITNNVHN